MSLQYELKIKNKIYGPYKTEQLKKIIRHKKLPASTQIRKHGQTQWQLLNKVLENNKAHKNIPTKNNQNTNINKPPENKTECPDCGYLNEESALFCSMCHKPFKKTDKISKTNKNEKVTNNNSKPADKDSSNPIELKGELIGLMKRKKGQTWDISLNDEEANFRYKDNSITIARKKSPGVINIANPVMTATYGYNLSLHKGIKSFNFLVPDKNLDDVREWIPSIELTAEDMEKELTYWGYSYFILGALHLIFSGIFKMWWGYILMAAGFLNIFAPRKSFFIFNGLLLFAAAGLNLYSSKDTGSPFGISLGVMQIVWGSTVIFRYFKY